MKNAVLISCFNWYENRLKPVSDMLANAGYEVTILVSDFDHINKKPVTTRFNECTYISVPQYRKNVSVQRIRSHLSFAKQCNNYLNEHKPELVYCQVPPNKVVDNCASYRNAHPNTKLIIDIIDLWPESLPLERLKNNPFTNKWKKWRDNAIKSADHVFTECAYYQDVLRGIVDPAKTSTLYLFKEQTAEEKQLVQETINQRNSDGILRFAYLGSMNSIIDIDGICGVLIELVNAGKKCEFHAIGDGESRVTLEEAVRKTGCKTYFYGPVFDEREKIKVLSSCDYAFNMMKDNVSVGLTIKSIDYLSFGLPLINNIKGDTWMLVKELKIGINISNNTVFVAHDYKEADHNLVLQVFKDRFTKESFIDSFGGVGL